MNTSASQKIKIGIFVIVGILLLVAGIFLIGSKKNMFADTYTIYGVFRNAGGLQKGNNIRFGGVNIGTVKDIRIMKDTVVRVDMIIQTEMREFIKKDAAVTVSSDGLMGDKLLNIEPGTPNAPILTAGSQIRTEEPVDFGSIITKFNVVADNAKVITGSLADMAVQIKTGNGTISRLLYRNDLAMGLENTLNNATAITGSVNGIATYIKSGKGSLGALIYTDTLAKNLEYTVATVQKAADNFSENMKALQGNIFFKGYFKKKAKAAADSSKALVDNEPEMSDADLLQIKEDADKEIERRRIKSASDAPIKNK